MDFGLVCVKLVCLINVNNSTAVCWVYILPGMLNSQLLVLVNDHIIHQVSNAKYLGVIIDHYFSWDDHIEVVTCKANGVNAFLHIYNIIEKLEEMLTIN